MSSSDRVRWQHEGMRGTDPISDPVVDRQLDVLDVGHHLGLGEEAGKMGLQHLCLVLERDLHPLELKQVLALLVLSLVVGDLKLLPFEPLIGRDVVVVDLSGERVLGVRSPSGRAVLGERERFVAEVFVVERERVNGDGNSDETLLALGGGHEPDEAERHREVVKRLCEGADRRQRYERARTL